MLTIQLIQALAPKTVLKALLDESDLKIVICVKFFKSAVKCLFFSKRDIFLKINVLCNMAYMLCRLKDALNFLMLYSETLRPYMNILT